MNEAVFPSPFNPAYRYAAGGDFVETKISGPIGNLYKSNTLPKVIKACDTSKITSTYGMFTGCSNMATTPLFDTSNVTTMGYMFSNCSKMVKVPQFDTSNVTSFQNMFENCAVLAEVPYLYTSNATNMNSMFTGCKMIKTIPPLDFSNASVTSLFYDCWNIRVLPDINCAKASSMSSMLYRLESVHTIGKIYCDSLTSVSNMISNSYPLKCLVNFGGFRNLGAQKSLSGTNGNYFMKLMPNLSRESLLNVLNELYDRKTAGYSVLTLTLHENHLAMLSDEEKAIATNKGWTLS